MVEAAEAAQAGLSGSGSAVSGSQQHNATDSE